MFKSISKHRPTMFLISVIGIVLTSANLRAEEQVPLSENITEETKDFLSDPARAGSLVGTIIAGAAIANPLAPILGSLAGFFIGKSTDYTNSTNSGKTQKNAYARRSFIPENNQQVASLSGLTSKQPQQTEQQIILTLPLEVGGKGNLQQQVNLGLEETVGGNRMQEQLAYACSQVSTLQQLPVYCYYYSQ